MIIQTARAIIAAIADKIATVSISIHLISFNKHSIPELYGKQDLKFNYCSVAFS